MKSKNKQKCWKLCY